MQYKAMSKQFVRFPTMFICLVFLVSVSSHAEDCEKAKEYYRQADNIPTQLGDEEPLETPWLEKEGLYRKAIELCPNYLEAHNNLADALENLGRYEEAVKEYQRAIEINENFPYAYFGIADIHLKRENYKDAIKWYDEGLNLSTIDKVPSKVVQTKQEARRQAGHLLTGKVISAAEIIESLNVMSLRGPGEVVAIPFGERLIPFDTSSSEIHEDAKSQLDEIGKALSHPQLAHAVIVIEGHTDVRGSAAYNQRLSEGRANAVKTYLVKIYEITPDRLQTIGHGEFKPKFLGSDDASHKMNRRVEISKRSEGKIGDWGEDAFRVFRLDKDGNQHPVSVDGTTRLKAGRDTYQIYFQPPQACYVYVLQLDTVGKWFVLFPSKNDGTQSRVEAGKRYWVPDSLSAFSLAGPKGEETIYLLATQNPFLSIEEKASQEDHSTGITPDYQRAIEIASQEGFYTKISFYND